MSSCQTTLHVALPPDSRDRGYPIHIGTGLLSNADLVTSLIGERPVMVVTNDMVAPLYLDTLHKALGRDRRVTELLLPDGEQHKTLDTLATIMTAALRGHHERRSVFVALGGGVIGDMTGFAAACYQRGVDFLQVPTTLLAQVDSSVGGKTGVNHSLGKNMIGAFHQPLGVIIDINTLQSLPEREFAAGMAEVIKYGLINDAPFFQWIIDAAGALADRDPDALTYAIERSCAIKADVVATDEREGGLRAILNFGHTFGHAIEHVQGYGNWLHGEAVACGMLMAARISHAKGNLDAAMVDALERLLKCFRLPVEAPADMDADSFLRAMSLDKKVNRGQIRYVLLSNLGRAVITSDVSRDDIERAIGR